MLCVWRGGLTPRPAAVCSILFLATLTTQGQVPLKSCTAGSCCSALHLMCCRGKLLAESRGNMGKGVALAFAYPTSPLPRYRKPGQKPCLWAGGSGVLVSSCSQPWGQPHARPAGQRGAPASFGQPIWMLQLPPLPSLLLPEGCAVGMAAQGAGPCWGDSVVWHHCLALRQGKHLAQAQNMPWQGPGAALLLNIDGYCLHGGLGAPALQIIFPAAGPALVPPRS